MLAFAMLTTRIWATPEQDFWTWFGKNDASLFDFEKNQDQVFKDLNSQMTKVDPNLTFEFGPKKDGKRDFVISAGGIHSSFPAVIALYDAAPKLDHWNLIKFRPRRSIADTEINFGGAKVAAPDVSFALDSEGSKVGITLFIKGYKPTPDKTYEQIGYLILDNALGEYDVETKVGGISIASADANPTAKKSPLIDLPKAFDASMQAAPSP
jgi:hypothetical protein